MYDVIIVGGGASGLMAAVNSTGNIAIVEKNDILGKKILATGNGRCNLSNLECCYESDFGNEILSLFDVEKTLDFFKKMGIETVSEKSRLYPMSLEAKSIRETLEEKALAKSEIIRGAVKELEQLDTGFKLIIETGSKNSDKNRKGNNINRLDKKTKDYEQLNNSDKNIRESGSNIMSAYSKAVIFATGGKAGPQYGLTGEGFRILKNLGHTIKKPIPALVPLVSESPFLRDIAGVRVNGRISLIKNDVEIATEKGQIQFNNDSISGICTFDLSRHVRDIKENRYRVRMDFLDFPSFNEKENVKKFLHKRANNVIFDKNFLRGILPEKLGQALICAALKNIYGIEYNGFDGAENIENQVDKKAVIEELARIVKSFEIEISGTKGWRDAQVTDGGICEEEIDRNTLESKLVKGLFLAGEVIDITGRCGGYNLQWAFSSGALAGESAGRYAENK